MRTASVAERNIDWWVRKGSELIADVSKSDFTVTENGLEMAIKKCLRPVIVKKFFDAGPNVDFTHKAEWDINNYY